LCRMGTSERRLRFGSSQPWSSPMIRLSLFTVCSLCVVAVSLGAPIPKEPPPDRFEPIDLKAKANHSLDDNFHTDFFAQNNISELKGQVIKREDMIFKLGDSILQLRCPNHKNPVDEINGIAVKRKALKLHFMHATGYVADNNTVIGKYVVKYGDKTKADIEIVYGKHVLDWWVTPDTALPTDGPKIWEGENGPSSRFKKKIRLYQLTWTNPKPDTEIVEIDFQVVNGKDHECQPFCLAITAEKPKPIPAKP
jgi:hypothetical protein